MRTFLLLTGTWFLLAPASAQVFNRQGNVGGTIGISVPKDEFADTWGHNMFTVGGQLTFPMGRVFQGGFDFGYATMVNTVSTVPVSDPALTATEGDLAVKAKIYSYHTLLRFSPLRGKVRPYVDGLVGLRQFTTLSTVTVDGLDQPVSRERDANDLAFSAGWAAGVMVRFAGIGYVEGRVERFDSGKATYVDPASISVDGQGGVGFNTLTSRTGVVNVLVGIGILF